LNADDGGQKQAKENQNAEDDKSEKVVSHGKPDKTAKAPVVHGPSNRGHPR
jgi:hypothetical protein